MSITLDTNLGRVAVVVTKGDLPEAALDKAAIGGLVGIDTETSGLDWANDRLGLVQVFVPALHTVYLIHPTAETPARLVTLLKSESWVKVFHFALFDLRFLAARWGITPLNIRCTKVASKLLAPAQKKHSLADLVKARLGVELDKTPSIRTSDWTNDELSETQLQYAALDAVYLPALFELLEVELQEADLAELASQSFSFLPTQLRADLLGVEGLFSY
ncbi:MAG: ribonuclease D [Bradymonadaceae bacterium]|nr:ribonuclease D [Lujinxingiaceae bacterium]